MQRKSGVFRGLTTGFASIALAAFAAGCGGGGGGGGSDAEFGANDLHVVDMDLDGLDGVSLNRPFTIEFSEWVRAETIRHDTVQIRVGPRYGIQSFGDFKVAGNTVTFFPQLPTKADLSDAGFQPQSQYRVTVLGNPSVNRVNSYTGRPLTRTFVGNFSTAAATSPDLFTTEAYADPPPPTVAATNPPDVLPVAANWDADGNGVYDAQTATSGGSLNVPTDADLSIQFNRVPLRPETITTTNVSLTMIERLGVIQNRPIQGTPAIEQTFEGTRLVFIPAFPLADQARYVLRIENRVTDLTGQFDVTDNSDRALLRSQAESGVDPALTAYAQDSRFADEFDPRTFLIFTTRDEPTKDLTLVMNFDGSDSDQDGESGVNTNATTASFNDAVPGAVAAQFTAAGGDGTLGDFTPTSDTTLSTNSPSAVNGAFNFQKIDIPAGVTVTIDGDLPATLLALKPVTIDGTIEASGGDGEAGEGTYTNSTLPRGDGGLAGPGSGDGGDSYTGSSWSNSKGGDGEDAPNGGGFGGTGGRESTSSTYGFGGGGSGGSHQYGGVKGANGNYPSRSSWNAAGGAGSSANGVQPASANTDDGKSFHNAGTGAGGGAAGGNSHYYPNSTNWRNGAAGGGGGGGALLIKGAGNITVTGSILAKGGNGGRAGNASSYGGAAGGGGAGGSIALYASLVLDVSNATLDTSGGTGGGSTGNNWPGRGGDGGGGFVQLEDEDGNVSGANSANILPDFYTGSFDPTGTADDAPSVFTSNWFNAGVFDPQIQLWTPQDFSEQNYPGATIQYELQMSVENAQDFGRADTSTIDALTGNSSDYSRASDWHVFKDGTNTIQDVLDDLNGKGYQFFRVRMSFTLPDGQKRDDPVPYVDQLKIRIKY